MEIILKQDVENLGFRDEIVSVKPGYGRNFLIPQGLGILATESARKMLAENLKQKAHKEAKIIAEAKQMLENFKNVAIRLTVKTGKGDKLFGSINNNDLSTELSKLGFQIDKKYITIVGGTIKNVGKYNANLRLHREVLGEIEFEVASN